MKFSLNDTVKLKRDLPAEGLSRGALGVVVAEFTKPEEASEVEFSDENGETVAQIALLPNMLEAAI
jgi:hypothetical protein